MSDGQSILKTSLLDLLHELRDEDIPLILGGGYGLYLKQVRLQNTLNTPTLIEAELWPAPRATEDLDILLRTEVVIDASRMGPIRAALDRLNYTAVRGPSTCSSASSWGAAGSSRSTCSQGPSALWGTTLA